ncbi:MAG: LLM class flavin-dependent oxidoreductase [Acidimicrobiales bacterium]
MRVGVEMSAEAPEQAGTPGFLQDPTSISRAARAAGVGTLWISEGRSGSPDPFPIAAAIAQVVPDMGIGVIVRPSLGRHPAIVARDLIALDAISGGRSSIALFDDGSGPLDAERLGEAASLMKALLTHTEVTVAGRFYQVAELTLRPRPVRAEGPEVIAGLASPLGLGEDTTQEEPSLLGLDGHLVVGGPPEVARCRLRLDATAPAGRPPKVVWRGTLDKTGRWASQLGELAEAGAQELIVVGESSSGLLGALDTLGNLVA